MKMIIAGIHLVHHKHELHIPTFFYSEHITVNLLKYLLAKFLS